MLVGDGSAVRTWNARMLGGVGGGDEPRDSGEPILRILTKPGEFNRGEPYYFILHKQDCPCVDAEGHTMPLRATTPKTSPAASSGGWAAGERRGLRGMWQGYVAE